MPKRLIFYNSFAKHKLQNSTYARLLDVARKVMHGLGGKKWKLKNLKVIKLAAKLDSTECVESSLPPVFMATAL